MLPYFYSHLFILTKAEVENSSAKECMDGIATSTAKQEDRLAVLKDLCL